MRLFRLVPALLLAGGGAFAAISVAQAPAAHAVSEATGTITAVSAVSLSLRSEDGTAATFVVDEPGVLPAGLAVGAHASVQYEPRDTGGRLLVSVIFAGAPPAPTVVPEGTPPTPLPETLTASSEPARQRSLDPGALLLLSAAGALLVICWR
jgi:hypothetical protein